MKYHVFRGIGCSMTSCLICYSGRYYRLHRYIDHIRQTNNSEHCGIHVGVDIESSRVYQIDLYGNRGKPEMGQNELPCDVDRTPEFGSFTARYRCDTDKCNYATNFIRCINNLETRSMNITKLGPRLVVKSLLNTLRRKTRRVSESKNFSSKDLHDLMSVILLVITVVMFCHLLVFVILTDDYLRRKISQ